MRETTTPVAEHSGILERLYAVEYSGMVRLAYTLVGSNAEAEDLVQDSFVEVARRLDEIRKPGAYLRSAVVSRCRSALRRRRVMALLRLRRTRAGGVLGLSDRGVRRQ